MKYKFFGKVMVMSIIAAGLLKVLQDLITGYSNILNNAKISLLVLALLSAVVAIAISSWKSNNKDINKYD